MKKIRKFDIIIFQKLNGILIQVIKLSISRAKTRLFTRLGRVPNQVTEFLILSQINESVITTS